MNEDLREVSMMRRFLDEIARVTATAWGLNPLALKRGWQPTWARRSAAAGSDRPACRCACAGPARAQPGEVRRVAAARPRCATRLMQVNANSSRRNSG